MTIKVGKVIKRANFANIVSNRSINSEFKINLLAEGEINWTFDSTHSSLIAPEDFISSQKNSAHHCLKCISRFLVSLCFNNLYSLANHSCANEYKHIPSLVPQEIKSYEGKYPARKKLIYSRKANYTVSCLADEWITQRGHHNANAQNVRILYWKDKLFYRWTGNYRNHL